MEGHLSLLFPFLLRPEHTVIRGPRHLELRPHAPRGRRTRNGRKTPRARFARSGGYAVALFRRRPVSVSPSAIKTVTAQRSSSPVVTGWSRPFGAGNFSLIVGINFDE